MKLFDWEPEKNLQLREQRGISFEEVVFHIMAGDVIDIAEHPNQTSYPGQRIFHVLIDGYVYLVPFVESDEVVFLKTIIPAEKRLNFFIR